MAKVLRRQKVSAFVLRSGYVVLFDLDEQAIIAELKQAIIDESLRACRKKRKTTKEVFEKEIVAECEHLAATMPKGLAQAILTHLLAGIVFDLVRNQLTQHDGQLPITNAIQ